LIDFKKMIEISIKDMSKKLEEEKKWEIENERRERLMMKYIPCVRCNSRLTISYVNGELCTKCKHFEENGNAINILGQPVKIRKRSKAREYEWKRYETELKKSMERLNKNRKKGDRYSYKRRKVQQNFKEGFESSELPLYEQRPGILHDGNGENTWNHTKWREIDTKATSRKGTGYKERNGRKSILQVV